MSKPNPDHPWHDPLTSRQSAARRHSVAFAAHVIRSLAHGSVTEVAAAAGLSRGAITGIIATARRAGIQVTFKRGRAPVVVEPIERSAHVHEPKPKPEPHVRSRTPIAPTAIVPNAVHETGVTLLEVRVGQCRALDDRRECCCLPTVAGSSWCAGHRAMYVASVRRAA